MSRAVSMLTLSGLLAAMTGCAMCKAPDDFTYAAYGGRVQREDMVHGRVGSILGPPHGVTVVPPHHPHEYQPTPAAPPAQPGYAPAPPVMNEPAPPALGEPAPSAAEGLQDIIRRNSP